ncbi:hypothetical protein N9R62_03015 [Porticoccaceae bacterium]|nr:hypothetical protein [Porticoccaceae bacterium]
MKEKLIFALISILLISGCGGSAEPNVVSRDDIADFCDAVSSNSDKKHFDHGIASGLGATYDQAEAMSRGAQLARVAYALNKEKSWEQHCKRRSGNNYKTKEIKCILIKG